MGFRRARASSRRGYELPMRCLSEGGRLAFFDIAEPRRVRGSRVRSPHPGRRPVCRACAGR